PANPVVHVDDEVAGLEVAEVGNERTHRRPAPFMRPAFLFEEIGLAEELERRRRKVEASRELSGGDEDGGLREIIGFANRSTAKLVLAEQLEHPLGPAGRRRDEDRGFLAVVRLAHLVDPVADPSPILEARRTRDVDSPAIIS